MTQVQPDRPPRRGRALRAVHPVVPSNPAELAGIPRPLPGRGRSPLRSQDPGVRGGVAQRLLQLLRRATVLPRGLSGHPGRAQRVADATAFHANVIAMERGELDVADVAADYVNCTQCGACELRCPNTLFTGDFYRFRTRTVDVVKAVRALAVESGSTSRSGGPGTSAPTCARTSRCSGRPGQPGQGPGLGRGPRHPDRRRDDPVRRLRGGVLPDVGPAGRRPDAADGRLRVRPHAGAVVLRRARRRDGLRRPGQEVRPAQPRQLARVRHQAVLVLDRTTTSASPRTTRSISARSSTSRSSS